MNEWIRPGNCNEHKNDELLWVDAKRSIVNTELFEKQYFGRIVEKTEVEKTIRNFSNLEIYFSKKPTKKIYPSTYISLFYTTYCTCRYHVKLLKK